MAIQRICTFCIGKCETIKYIEKNTKNILALFLPEMEFTTIQEPVMCENCTETLEKCFEFKTTCLHTYDYLVSFVNNKDNVKLDLNDLFQSRSMADTGIPEDQDICGFCMALVENCNAVPLYITDKDYKLDKMVQQCLPELDLSVIMKPVICADCHSSLESCYRFVTNCLTAEQRIRQYRENLVISSKGQIELSDLLHPAIKAENTNGMDSELFDIVKIEKQICEDGENLEQNEMVSGVNVIKLEETSCINENSNNNENVNESLMISDDPKVSIEQQWSPKNFLVWEEQSNNLDAIKIEETLCEENESKCKDDFLEEDKKCLINAEIEIKTEGQDFNRFEEGLVKTKPRHNIRLTEKCLMPTLDEQQMTYQCNLCSFQTKNRNDFEKHLLTHKYSSLTMMNSFYSCSIQAKQKNSLEKHVPAHTNFSKLKMYNCYSCRFQTIYKNSIREHCVKHKDTSEITINKCDSCSYQTTCKDLFERHSRKCKNPSEVTMYKCDSCTFQSRYRYYLNRHSVKHKDLSEVTMYKCHSCTFQTRYKSSIKIHVLKH